MTETTFENARVGDLVEDIKYGEGEIVLIRDKPYYYQIHVSFSEHGTFQYGIDGRSGGDYGRTLFWPGVQVIAPERPMRIKKVKIQVRPYRDYAGELKFTTCVIDNYLTIGCGPVQEIEVEVEE